MALWRVLDIYKREAITPQNLASLAFAGTPIRSAVKHLPKTKSTRQNETKQGHGGGVGGMTRTFRVVVRLWLYRETVSPYISG